MPDMSILEPMSENLAFAIFVLIILAVVNTLINIIMWWTVAKMKNGVVWEDRFIEFKDSITDRVKSLESVRNGT